MLIEVKNFPSDPYCVLGDLRTQLVYALHTSSQSKITADLLGKTLSTASKLLKAVKRDSIKRNKLLTTREKERAEKDAVNTTDFNVDIKEIARMEKEIKKRALPGLKRVTKG